MEDELLWMENLQDARVIDFIVQENTRLRNFLGELPERIYPEIRRYMGIPVILKIRATERGYFKLYRREDEYVIMRDDEKILSSKELGENVIIQNFYVDDKGEILAYTYSEGTDEGITRILDLSSGNILDELRGSVEDIIWLEKNRYYYLRFYRKGSTPDGIDAPAVRVFLREDGKEKMVFGEGLPTSHFIHLRKTQDGKFALLTVSYGWNRSDVYFGPLESPEEWRKVYGGDFMCYPIDYRDELYILSYEGSGLGKVVTPSREVIPEGKYPMEGAALLGSRIVAVRLRDASSMVEIYNLKGKRLETLEFDMPGSVEIMDTLKNELLLHYTSFSVPYRIYRIRKEMELIESENIVGEYELEEDWAVSKDGTRVHMFIVKKRNIQCSKALVYGYGGFSISLKPCFFPHIIPFLERGGCFVVTNLRGGGEYGEKWHHDGMREKKQNVFDDYIACLEKLKSLGMDVVAWGRSNGGLLVSAVLVQRPDVMDGALIGYPVIDMLRFHKLYIGAAWIPEYGNPDTEDREFLVRYSPYHKVMEKNYPPTLIYTGLYDDRVHPGHALKFARKLKDVGAPVYLRVETKSGHIGASQEIRARELSDIMAFVMKILKL